MKVYLSGPISGVATYKEVFAAHAATVSTMGHEVVDPSAVSISDWTWADYMQHDLSLLKDCDAIYLLPGWEQSRGARIERRYAKRNAIPEFVQQRPGRTKQL
jgi:hypothetical protein